MIGEPVRNADRCGHAGDVIGHPAHLDLHRLSTLAGEDPGLLDDYVDAATIAFVEWPEVAESELSAAVRVRLEHLGGDRRRIEVRH